ncbi:helix-turn-helix domain-containing protein [Apibacter raozihei]|uniref:winged helix-turn-helix transcriptional regulator n=1 Tax=Apibacter TaxID=1778601 RepID=UPI000FE437E0|nr:MULTISPECIES: helix-turn-helix domain-containing protein [Apibacter]
MKTLNLEYPTCPVRNVLSRFSDKWSLLVLSVLSSESKLRYGEINKKIPDISQKMLTHTLKNLEEYNLVNRKSYPEIPPKVEYSLTETGKSLLPAIQMLIDWASTHFNEVNS